ncbi:hypothetical protein D3C85_1524800 [compost metagenome]
MAPGFEGGQCGVEGDVDVVFAAARLGQDAAATVGRAHEQHCHGVLRWKPLIGRGVLHMAYRIYGLSNIR